MSSDMYYIVEDILKDHFYQVTVTLCSPSASSKDQSPPSKDQAPQSKDNAVPKVKSVYLFFPVIVIFRC